MVELGAVKFDKLLLITKSSLYMKNSLLWIFINNHRQNFWSFNTKLLDQKINKLIT